MRNKIKQRLMWLGGLEYTWLVLLVLVTLAAHLSIINLPNKYLFDEQHYVPDALSILKGEGTLRLEHPPLGKLIMASGLAIFGDNPIGWRLPSVIFGTAGIIFFYLICRQMAMSKKASFLATFILAFETLTFVQASIAMLDVFSVTLMLASFWLYLKGKYPLAGLFIGLSTLAKLIGVLAIFAIVLHWLLVRRDRPLHFAIMMLMAPVSFGLLMIPLDFAVFRHFVNPAKRILDMMSLSRSLTFAATTHAFAQRPWEWIMGLKLLPYWYNPNYIGTASYSLIAGIIPSFVYMVIKVFKRHSAAIFGLAWFASTYLAWFPITFITDRISYAFYFYPSVGAISLGLGLGLARLIEFWQKKPVSKMGWLALFLAGVFLIAHVAVFAFESPLSHWWGIPFLKFPR